MPRWWAQRVGAAADHSFTAGVFAGLTCGVVFTAAPLLVAALAVRRHVGWRTRVTALVIALVVAVPNLTTLGIVVGGADAAHAGAQIMDVEAPGFRGATLIGAIAGVVLVAVLVWSQVSRRRRRRELERLRTELRRRDEEQTGTNGAAA